MNAIERAAESVVDAYDKYGQGLAPSFIAAIIKRELEKAAPAKVILKRDRTNARRHGELIGYNECRRTIGLGNTE